MAMEHLAELGYVPWVVERNITPIIKRDLFNCIDILALRGKETLAVQVTSAPNHAARVNKVQESEHLALMLGAGWGVEVWSYKGSVLRRTGISAIIPM
jgi:hypothetical protein